MGKDKEFSRLCADTTKIRNSEAELGVRGRFLFKACLVLDARTQVR